MQRLFPPKHDRALRAALALCAGLTSVNLVLFFYVASCYRYKDVKHAQKRYVAGTSLKPPRGPVPPWARAREVGIPISHRRQVSCSYPPSFCAVSEGSQCHHAFAI